MQTTPYEIISMILAISYTFVWSVSFYFQAFLIVRVKSAEGYSIDFQVFNLIGFSYLLGNNIRYILEEVNFGNIMDIVFAVNALLMSILIFILSFTYPRSKNKFNMSVAYIILVILAMTGLFHILNVHSIHAPVSDVLIFMGLTKALMSTMKYIYQIYLNSDRKSTEGFSNANVFLDFAGGSLSLAQEILKMIYENDHSVFGNKANLAKFMLSIVVMFFDLIFFYQIYKYRGKSSSESNNQIEEGLYEKAKEGQWKRDWIKVWWKQK